MNVNLYELKTTEVVVNSKSKTAVSTKTNGIFDDLDDACDAFTIVTGEALDAAGEDIDFYIEEGDNMSLLWKIDYETSKERRIIQIELIRLKMFVG